MCVCALKRGECRYSIVCLLASAVYSPLSSSPTQKKIGLILLAKKITAKLMIGFQKITYPLRKHYSNQFQREFSSSWKNGKGPDLAISRNQHCCQLKQELFRSNWGTKQQLIKRAGKNSEYVLLAKAKYARGEQIAFPDKVKKSEQARVKIIFPKA